jgi:hypothetical protein
LRPAESPSQTLAVGLKLSLASVLLAQGVWFYFLAMIEFGPGTTWATGKEQTERYIGHAAFAK